MLCLPTVSPFKPKDGDLAGAFLPHRVGRLPRGGGLTYTLKCQSSPVELLDKSLETLLAVELEGVGKAAWERVAQLQSEACVMSGVVLEQQAGS